MKPTTLLWWALAVIVACVAVVLTVSVVLLLAVLLRTAFLAALSPWQRERVRRAVARDLDQSRLRAESLIELSSALDAAPPMDANAAPMRGLDLRRGRDPFIQ